MNSFMDLLKRFFGVVARGQTYLNMLYLLLAFPLGVFYFVFLITGLSLSVGLAILWIGLLLLLVVFGVWYALAAFERQMAIWLLREPIAPMNNQDLTGKSAWENLKIAVTNPVTWKGLVYLFAKFPLGIVSFVALVTLIALSLSLLAAPLYFQWVQPQVDFTINGAGWEIDTLGEALLLSLAGVFVTLVSMHLLNGLAWISGKFARVMLGNFSPAPLPPAVPPAPEAPEAAMEAA